MAERFSIVAVEGSSRRKMRVRQFLNVIPRVDEEVILPGKAGKVGTAVMGRVVRIVNHLNDLAIGPSVWVSVESVDPLNKFAGWEIQDD